MEDPQAVVSLVLLGSSSSSSSSSSSAEALLRIDSTDLAVLLLAEGLQNNNNSLSIGTQLYIC